MSARSHKRWLVGWRATCLLAAACLAVFGTGWILHGGDLLYRDDLTQWFVALPGILLVLSSLLAWRRDVFFLALMPPLAWIAVDVWMGWPGGEGRDVQNKRVDGVSYITYDCPASFCAIPNTWATMATVNRGRRELEATYRFDEYGRRETPLPEGAPGSRAAVFLGGSRAFGSGIEDDETLAAAFSRQRPEFRSYNYAFQRYGPAQHLDTIRSRDVAAEIPEPLDLIVYSWSMADIKRVIGTMRVATRYCRRCSNYVVDEDTGEVRRHGDFNIGRPFRTIVYNLANRSKILRSMGVDYPWRYEPEHLEHAVAVLDAVRSEWLTAAPEANFVVVLGPERHKTHVAIPFMEQRGIPVMNFRGIYSPKNRKMTISKRDNHPSPAANDLLAHAIAEALDETRTAAQ